MSGPSFLGLADEPPRRNLDYLLEDEPPSSRGRVYLALLLLVLIAVFLVWRWRRDGYPWAGTILGKTLSSAPAAPSPTGAGTAAESPAPTALSDSPSTTPGADHPAPAAAAPATETIDLGPPPGTQSKVAGSAVPQSKASESQTPANSAPGATDQAPPQPTDRSASDDSAAKQDDATAPAAERAPATKVETPAAKLSVTKDQAASSFPTSEDKLVADGERYLYGTGVPQSCDRARKNLFTAASNAKAQSLLGAMYATGHCVNRDLPSAYRWFAKALHQEPGNERVARDLEVLWKQMTPAEKQAAVRGQQ